MESRNTADSIVSEFSQLLHKAESINTASRETAKIAEQSLKAMAEALDESEFENKAAKANVENMTSRILRDIDLAASASREAEEMTKQKTETLLESVEQMKKEVTELSESSSREVDDVFEKISNEVERLIESLTAVSKEALDKTEKVQSEVIDAVTSSEKNIRHVAETAIKGAEESIKESIEISKDTIDKTEKMNKKVLEIKARAEMSIQAYQDTLAFTDKLQDDIKAARQKAKSISSQLEETVKQFDGYYLADDSTLTEEKTGKDLHTKNNNNGTENKDQNLTNNKTNQPVKPS